ncbi:50S ribosomal protein L29 [Desulfosarcina widdelii]|uniref:Large ribosomal subunit protein uL29 n=1 Tax=Desulfosarcina widdelii TaxID=947919 RepID=A0A5K7Z2G4_9BACT|nr:50S ribosomal protein L29 [Desulfosarcina widdelii]BBO74885.1 50S ribosomal protein L29 [Desulfosarcina widdelii]
MKASEIRELGTEEIQQKISELKETLFNLRFQHEVGQLENPKKIGETKKDIARLRTVLNAKNQPQEED